MNILIWDIILKTAIITAAAVILLIVTAITVQIVINILYWFEDTYDNLIYNRKYFKNKNKTERKQNEY